MKKKILITALFLAFFVLSISGLSTVRADEMFFVDFYVVDSQGSPLNGVQIEVTGVYNYDEITYTGSDGYAPSLTLLSDQRNVQYNYTATYQQITQNGDFYVPNNYNGVNIAMVDVNEPTPSPTPSPPPPTASPSPSPPVTQNPTTNPTSNPTSNPTANQIATPAPGHSTAITPTPTENSQTTAPTAEPSPTVPEFPSILAITVLITAALIGTIVLKKKQSKDKLKQ